MFRTRANTGGCWWRNEGEVIYTHTIKKWGHGGIVISAIKHSVASSWFFFSTHMQRCTDKHTSNLLVSVLQQLPRRGRATWNQSYANIWLLPVRESLIALRYSKTINALLPRLKTWTFVLLWDQDSPRQMAQINRERTPIISVGTGEQPPAVTEGGVGGKNAFSCIGKTLGFILYVFFHSPSRLVYN